MSLCGTMSGSIMLIWCKHGFRPMRNLPPCIYPHTLPSLTRLRNFSPHGDGRFMIGTLMNKSLFSRPWMTPAMTSFAIRHARRFFPRCLDNENIHCDVDENLWPNPQHRVDDNVEVTVITPVLFLTVQAS